MAAKRATLRPPFSKPLEDQDQFAAFADDAHIIVQQGRAFRPGMNAAIRAIVKVAASRGVRVLGVENLRVIDGSIMPENPRPDAPVFLRNVVVPEPVDRTTNRNVDGFGTNPEVSSVLPARNRATFPPEPPPRYSTLDTSRGRLPFAANVVVGNDSFAVLYHPNPAPITNAEPP